MLGVKHIHPSHHTDGYIRSISNLSHEQLHIAQNELWTIVDYKDGSYSIILAAHQTKVKPTPIIEIDTIRYTGLGERPDDKHLNELIREFLGDKRHKFIYAPMDLEDPQIINCLVRFGFLYEANTSRYSKVPYNY